MEKYMKIALKLANKSYQKNDIPVGVVIVKDNKIISKAYNKKHIDQISVNHAEIIAIKKACKKLKSWCLDDCEIYITLEPCLMCYGAIVESRIKKIIYGCESPKYGFSNYILENNIKKIEIIKGIKANHSQFLLRSFFEKKRNKI